MKVKDDGNWLRLLWHVAVFGIVSPFVGAVSILSVVYLNLEKTPLAALLGGAIGVLLFSPILIASAFINYFICKIILKKWPSTYKVTCLMMGVLWGTATGIMFFPILDELEINLLYPPIAGAIIGFLSGSAVFPFWRNWD